MKNPQNTSPKMIFLIGAARSGTKFLRNLLAESEAASCVPFDINYVWRYRNESQPDDIISPELVSEDIAVYIRQTLASMAKKASGKSFPVVIEKTVSNVFRVPFILRIFPDAKFIHLLRDGREASLSAARQWEAPSDMTYLIKKLRYFPIRNWVYGTWYLRDALRNRLGDKKKAKIWGPRYPGIDQDIGNFSTLEVAAKQWSESVFAAYDGLTLVPAERQFAINYEDLVSDPQHLRKLVKFLELSDEENVVAEYERQVSRNKGGAWRQLPQEDQSRLMEILKPALTKCGYLI